MSLTDCNTALAEDFIKNISLPNTVTNLDRILFIREKYWNFIDSNSTDENSKIDFHKFCEIVYTVYNIQNSKLSDDLIEYKMYNNRSTRAGLIIFNTDNTKVLLLQNIGNDIWSFPKGKSNPNEPALNCAIRETKEETNLSVNIKNIYPKYVKFKSSAFRCKYIFYIVHSVSEKVILKPKNNEISNIKWFNLKDIFNMKCKLLKGVYKTLTTDIVQEYLQAATGQSLLEACRREEPMTQSVNSKNNLHSGSGAYKIVCTESTDWNSECKRSRSKNVRSTARDGSSTSERCTEKSTRFLSDPKCSIKSINSVRKCFQKLKTNNDTVQDLKNSIFSNNPYSIITDDLDCTVSQTTARDRSGSTQECKKTKK